MSYRLPVDTASRRSIAAEASMVNGLQRARQPIFYKFFDSPFYQFQPSARPKLFEVSRRCFCSKSSNSFTNSVDAVLLRVASRCGMACLFSAIRAFDAFSRTANRSLPRSASKRSISLGSSALTGLIFSAKSLTVSAGAVRNLPSDLDDSADSHVASAVQALSRDTDLSAGGIRIGHTSTVVSWFPAKSLPPGPKVSVTDRLSWPLNS